MKRYNLSELVPLENTNSNIVGNYHVSAPIEINIPGYDKTGFYKENRTIINEIDSPDYDLREYLSAQLLEKLEIPHADVLLARNDKVYETDPRKTNACISMNILNKDEQFVEMPVISHHNETSHCQFNLRQTKHPIDEYIEDDLEKTEMVCKQHMPSKTSKDLKEINGFKKDRKEFLVKRLFISALISDHDFRTDNMLLIHNKKTGELRNPPYYDMGLAFVKDEHKRFWGMTSEQVLDYLYEKYPSIITPFGKQVTQRFTKIAINEVMQMEDIKNGFSNSTWNYISSNLFHKTEILEHYQSSKKYKFRYGVDKVHDAVKGVSFFLKEHSKRWLEKLKNKDIEK